MLVFFHSVTRIVKLFHVLIIAVAIMWITNTVDSSVQSALPYILVALIAWEFTRVIAMRHKRQTRERRKQSRMESPNRAPTQRGDDI